MRLVAASMVTLLVLLAACTTPEITTTARDSSYRHRLHAVDVVLVKTSFPGVRLDLQKLDDLSWYQQSAQRLSATLERNGISSTSTAISQSGDMATSTVAPQSTAKLLLVPTKVVIRNGAIDAFDVSAKLFVPGRQEPIWEGRSFAAIYRAGDELALKLLNALSVEGLIQMNHTGPAQTLDGKTSSSLGGVFTK